MTNSEVAIIGIVYQPKWYKGKLKSIKHTDKIRGDLILYSVRFAIGVGYKMVLVDGGSSKTFFSELKKIPGVTIFQSKIHKRSPGRRKALFAASKIPGVRAIVMTEIEKVSFITDCLAQSIEPILSEEADIVIPKRENSLFQKSYPKYMYESEIEGNLLYNEALRSYGLLSAQHEGFDTFFGARVFANDHVMLKKIFSKYDGHPFNGILTSRLFDLEEYSNGQFFPIVKALFQGYRVKSVTVPFVYPEKQKENEEKGEREQFILKRRYQRLTIIVELMHFLGYLEHKKTRKIKKT
ncbi:MAG: hypothetical protein Q7T54_01295 [Candidatus Levybacteria bacterium]|nr:hypothetical protein [Candidatus Levybacteria bacterium]